ncbi:MAG: hypothetical protein ACRDG4_18815, partial [Chloroflexota bacterium]
VKVSPGGKVNTSLTVRNSGPVVDRFLLTVTGLEPAWYTVGAPTASLGPGSEETISLTIHPPLGDATHAGTYPVTVQVASEDDPNGAASAGLTVVVTTAGSVSMSLAPRQAQGRSAIYDATFLNRSNADATMVLTADDDENVLDFRMRPDHTVDVPAGEEVTISVRVRPEERHFVGQPRAFTFTLTAMHENDPFPVEIDPTLTTKARFTYIPRAQSLSLPRWLWYPIQLIFKLLVLLVALFLIFWLLKAIATGGTNNGNAAASAQVSALRATITAATLTPGSGKAAATAGAQLTAIARGTTVVLGAGGPKAAESATATPTGTASGKGGGSKAGPGKSKGHKTPVPPAPTPNITQFTLIPSGSYVAATWQVNGATSVQLNGQVVPINGAIALPAGASVALLQAFNGKSTVQQALPVPTLSVPAAGAAGDTTGGAGAIDAAGGTAGAASGGAAGGAAVGGAAALPATVTPLPTATPYPTSTPLPTVLPTSTAPPAPTATIKPSPAPAPPTVMDTATVTIVPTATIMPTDTAPATPTDTASPSPSPSPSHTASPSHTPTNTASPSPSPSASATATPSPTPTLIPDTATATETETIVPMPTVTVLGTEPITGTEPISGSEPISSTFHFHDTVPTSTVTVPPIPPTPVSTPTTTAAVSETPPPAPITASTIVPSAAVTPADTPTITA